MLDRSNGAVPVVHVVHAEAVGDAAAWETHKSRMQVGERFHQIGAEVLETVIRGAWLKGDKIEIDDAFAGEGQAQRALRGHACAVVVARRNGQ